MIKKARYFTKLFFIVLIAFAVYIIFKDLGKATLENWDEAWYAEATKQILKTKDFIILRWNGEIFLDKPPMYIWLSVVSSYLFGLSEFSVRLVSALSGFTIVIAVLLFSFKRWGFLPSFIAFVSILLNNIFIWRSRSGNIDTFATLLIFIAFFLIISNRKNKYILLGVLFGLIYLTKLSLVFFPFIIFILYEAIYKREKLEKNIPEYVKLLTIFITLSGLWLFLGFARIGKEFIEYFIFNSDQGVSHINLLSFKSDYWDYAYNSLQRRYYAIFLLGIFFLAKGIRDSKNFLILLFSLSLLIFLSFTEKNNNWYLVPSMPFWSLAIGYGTYKLLQIFHYSKFIQLPLLFLVLYISYRTFSINILPIMNTYSTADQAQSSRIIKELSTHKDVVIRLDHLYPAAIYYSDRIFFASPIGANTNKYFISRADVVEGIKNRRFNWLMGTREEVVEFIKQNTDLKLKIIDVNRSESILQVI